MNMTPEQFVSCIRAEILEHNFALYRGMLKANYDGKQTDLYWLRTAALYKALNEDQRDVYEQFIRQVMVDTLSNVLGVLDGTSILGKYRGEFTLSYDGDTKNLNGDLQDYFLAGKTKVSGKVF